jgi:hypothetical protein
MEFKINYEDIDSIITVFQRNGWKTSFVSDESIEGYPIIKAVHENGNKTILILTVEPDKFENPAYGIEIFDKFKSLNNRFAAMKKYISCLSDNTGSKEVKLREVS